MRTDNKIYIPANNPHFIYDTLAEDSNILKEIPVRQSSKIYPKNISSFTYEVKNVHYRKLRQVDLHIIKCKIYRITDINGAVITIYIDDKDTSIDMYIFHEAYCKFNNVPNTIDNIDK